MSTSIPSIPTDNLYKFIAIFGLLIFLFSLYISLTILPEKQSELTKMHSDIIRLNYDFQDDTLNFNFLNRMTRIVKKSQELDSLYFLMNQYSIKLISINSEQINTKANLGTINSNISSISKTSFWLRHLGMTMMFIGFSLWFYNYQIYQDLLVRKEFNDENKNWRIELRNKATSVGLLVAFLFTSTILFLMGIYSATVQYFIFPIIVSIYAYYAGKNSV